MINGTCKIAGAVLAILGLGACQGPVQPPSDAEQMYREACVLCHAGPGPGASAPDLTTLSAVNGGSFPMDQVIAIIDGREGVRAHGSPMPVWAQRHSADEVRELALYLASIQQ